MSFERPPAIAVVDYGMGNRRSVEKALVRVGARVSVTADHGRLSAADALVLPGVGAFARGIESLRRRGLDRLLCARAAAGVPLLGICLGMQLLFDSSTELGQSVGLGLIAGEVRQLDSAGAPLPHIGWNDVCFDRPSPLTRSLPSVGAAFYHVHSFAAHPADEAHVIGSTEYGERFATIVADRNVFGVQFHPEKSSHDGLRLLGDFCALACERTAVGA